MAVRRYPEKMLLYRIIMPVQTRRQRENIIKQQVALDATTNAGRRYSPKRVAKMVVGLLGFASIAAAAIQSGRDPRQALTLDYITSYKKANHYCGMSNASHQCQIAKIESEALEMYMKRVDEYMNAGLPQKQAFMAAEHSALIPGGNVNLKTQLVVKNVRQAQDNLRKATSAKLNAELALRKAQTTYKNANKVVKRKQQNAKSVKFPNPQQLHFQKAPKTQWWRRWV
jgi:hypothetical protein